jgi:hypothetical protein
MRANQGWLLSLALVGLFGCTDTEGGESAIPEPKDALEANELYQAKAHALRCKFVFSCATSEGASKYEQLGAALNGLEVVADLGRFPDEASCVAAGPSISSRPDHTFKLENQLAAERYILSSENYMACMKALDAKARAADLCDLRTWGPELALCQFLFKPGVAPGDVCDEDYDDECQEGLRCERQSGSCGICRGERPVDNRCATPCAADQYCERGVDGVSVGSCKPLKQAGVACNDIVEPQCARGLDCISSKDAQGERTGPQACEALPIAALGESCDGYNPCGTGLLCKAGSCVAAFSAQGAPCVAGKLPLCEAGLVCGGLKRVDDGEFVTLEGACAKPGGVGAACIANTECSGLLHCAGALPDGSATGACAEAAATGEPCVSDADCASQKCNVDSEAPGTCGRMPVAADYAVCVAS